MQHASCLNQPTDIFFPEYQGNTSESIWIRAKEFCHSCPVRKECLALAMSFESPDYRRHGIWGGLTPDDRDELYKKLFS